MSLKPMNDIKNRLQRNYDPHGDEIHEQNNLDPFGDELSELIDNINNSPYALKVA